MKGKPIWMKEEKRKMRKYVRKMRSWYVSELPAF
jgi:hypothetical protein